MTTTLALTSDLWDSALDATTGINVVANLVDVGDDRLVLLQQPRTWPWDATLLATHTDVCIQQLNTRIQIDRVRVVGPDEVRMITRDKRKLRPAFARQSLALGNEAQRVLDQLHVGVAGASGTGSPVFEQLVRLGVGEITVADDDVVDHTNVPRLHESTLADCGRLKVDVLTEAADRIGLDTVVNPIASKVTDRATVERLRHCDMLFSCTDDHAGRAILSRLSYRYLIPLVDCGVQVSTDGDRMIGVHGSIIAVGPGHPCLICAGQVDPQIAHAESLSLNERHRLQDEGYIPDLEGETPSVIPYTTAVASFAVADMLHRLIGIPGIAANQLLWFDRQRINIRDRQAQPGHYCTDHSYIGGGDCEPLLGVTW